MIVPVRPERLREGDTVGIVTPSWGGPHAFPNIYAMGVQNLRDLFGLKIKGYSTTRAFERYLRAHPQARANDINQAFSDPEVTAIISSIGGDDSVRILPYLDLDIILDNPKIIMGFSDTTTILSYLNQQGMVTFNGPSVMAGFSQMKSMPTQVQEHMRDVLFSGKKPLEYQPFPTWSEGYPQWKEDKNLGLTNPPKANRGWLWLQGERKVSGRLFGGCFEILEMMKGSRFWPSESFWKGKILFLETSENVPSIDQVVCGLRNYGIQGALGSISALLIGRARGFSTAEKKKLDMEVKSVVSEEFSRDDLPIISNMDFGHTDPQLILPLGCKAEVDPSRQRFRLLEAPVS